MPKSASPLDLARAVQANVRRSTKTNLRLRFLSELFEALFAASLKTEEGQPITCHVSYLDPENPDPTPPKRLRRDRWTYVPFSDAIPLTVPNIVKLAKATDPRSSSFVVYPGKDDTLYIWGLVDQGNSTFLFANYDTESGFARPGVFHVSIAGLAHLIAFDEFTKVAELRVNTLIQEAHDILRAGPVHELLIRAVAQMAGRVNEALGPEIGDAGASSIGFTAYEYMRSLSRLLIRAVGYGHGGAILITPDEAFDHLRTKHRIAYPRLGSAIEARALSKIQELHARAEISKHLDNKSDDIPATLYLDEAVFRDEDEDCTSEIDGAIWFISLLTRVDGLVLMTPDLTVYGFGVEITAPAEPPAVFLAGDSNGTVKNLKELPYEHYGTRHRSMMRYCSAVPGSVGFVISQDGDVRAIAHARKRLIVWDNLKLQMHEFAKWQAEISTTTK